MRVYFCRDRTCTMYSKDSEQFTLSEELLYTKALLVPSVAGAVLKLMQGCGDSGGGEPGYGSGVVLRLKNKSSFSCLPLLYCSFRTIVRTFWTSGLGPLLQTS